MQHVAEKALEGLDREVQTEEVVRSCLMDIISMASGINKMARALARAKTATSSEKTVDGIKTNLLHTLDSVLLCAHVSGVDLPDTEELMETIAGFSDEIQTDIILASSVANRGACDALIHYFEDEAEVSEEFIMGLGEALCAVAIICNRIGIEFDSLIHEKV